MKTPIYLFGLILLLMVTPAAAQSNVEEVAVKDVLVRLFTGMKTGDSAMVHSAFSNAVTLATVYHDLKGNTVIDHETFIASFLNAVGTPHKQIWSEEIWDVKILTDDNMAQVWCNYAFFLDNQFSHCGVDAFQLVKDKTGWKIFHLADTRRKTPCEIPARVKEKHN